jgi:hypothetical protein
MLRAYSLDVILLPVPAPNVEYFDTEILLKDIIIRFWLN